MPWTLYRSIIAELLKVMALAAAALVGVLSFAVAIKPLSEGTLGPAKVMSFSLLMSPWLLRIALPFAAAFAGVVVFLRLSADREITACLAGGISHGRILLPVAGLALALALLHGGLSHYVVPGFYGRAKAMLERDLIRALVGRVEAGRAVSFENWVLYADRAATRADPEPVAGSEAQPDELVLLEGMALGRQRPDGSLQHVATCRRASLFLYRVRGHRWVTMRLEDALRLDRPGGSLEEVGEMAIPPIRLPSPLERDPDFLSAGGLKCLRKRPAQARSVGKHRRRLVRALVTDATLGALRARIRTEGPLELVAASGTRYAVQAASAVRTHAGVRLAGPVRVRRMRDGAVTRRLLASQGRLRIGGVDPDGRARVRGRLERVRVTDEASGLETERRRRRLPVMRLDPPISPEVAGLTVAQLLDRAGRDRWRGVEAVERAADRLRRAVRELGLEIDAVREERRALAAAAGLALLLGVLAGIRFPNGTALGVYFGVFLVTLTGVLVIFCGDKMDSPLAIALVTWAGAAVIAAPAVGLFGRLGREA